MNLQFHELLTDLPLLEGEALQSLADDIKANGLLSPVELYQGKVLNGRNRCRACELAGVEPTTREVNPRDPVAYVMSANLHRLHQTPSQRAMMAAWARGQYDKQAKERQEATRITDGKPPVVEIVPPPGKQVENGKSRDKAGKAAGVSGRTVDKATKVRKEGIPALGKLVESGNLDVTKAAKIATLPKETQETLLEDAQRNDWSPGMMMEEFKRLSPKPPEPPCKAKKGDSPVLQELKSAWKRASKADKQAFKEWINA